MAKKAHAIHSHCFAKCGRRVTTKNICVRPAISREVIYDYGYAFVVPTYNKTYTYDATLIKKPLSLK